MTNSEMIDLCEQRLRCLELAAKLPALNAPDDIVDAAKLFAEFAATPVADSIVKSLEDARRRLGVIEAAVDGERDV